MEHIRPFHPDDLQPVSALFQKVFRHTNAPPPSALTAYFDDLYLNNPWRDAAINSLVYERDGVVSGFLGAIPFPMTLNGKPIRAAIGGNYMIDPEHPNPLAGIKILKTLLSGPQDVTYSDTATATAQKIWAGLGSASIPIYSMQWLRILRPMQFGAVMSTRNTPLRSIALISRPITAVFDRIASSIPKSPFYVKSSSLNEEMLTGKKLFESILQFSKHDALAPQYTEESLAWLFKRAGEKKEYGPLKSVALLDKQNQLQGYYLYYPNSGGLGQVLQFCASPKTVDAVLGHLFHDALKEGSLALAGRAEPKYIPAFSSLQCIFTHRNSSLVVNTKNTEIVNALHRGDAFFTRLEGEWWTRLQGDSFDE